jgi:predicted P-loop ATPase
VTKEGKIKKTILNFKSVLCYYGISLSYNLVRREIIYRIKDKNLSRVLGTGEHFDELVTYCMDVCCKEGLPAKRDDIYNWLYYIANESKFNHIKDSLVLYHDKFDQDLREFEKLMECIKFKNNTEFSKTLFKKALWQSVAMIHNENGEYGADGALTLQGSQAIGKTSLLRKICECFGLEYFKESAEFSTYNKKDDILQNTSVFMCELGEAKKSVEQVDWMKRFITNPIDEVRPPYARSSRKAPRLTTFYLTVNDHEFLKDVENRRYWTVEIQDINLNGVNSINYPALWAEAYSWYLENPVGFRLSYSERIQLNSINSEFRILSTEERVLLDCLNWEQPVEDWTERTATQISTEIMEETGQRISPQKVGTALKGMGYEKEAPPKAYRTLQGRTLYSTPNVKKSTETGQPFDENMKGRALHII